MFKSMIAAALISMMSGNTAVSNINTLGGYTPDEEAVCETNEVEYKEKFDEAIAGVIGCDYEVSRLHEVQIVNGTNYIFSLTEHRHTRAPKQSSFRSPSMNPWTGKSAFLKSEISEQSMHCIIQSEED